MNFTKEGFTFVRLKSCKVTVAMFDLHNNLFCDSEKNLRFTEILIFMKLFSRHGELSLKVVSILSFVEYCLDKLKNPIPILL